MRLYGWLLLILAAVAGVGLLLMYGQPDRWRDLRIRVGSGAEAAEPREIVLPPGRTRVLLDVAGEVVPLEIVCPASGGAGAPPPVLFVLGPSGRGPAFFRELAPGILDAGFAAARLDARAVAEDVRSDALLAAIGWLERARNVEHRRIGILAASDAAPLALVVASLAGVTRVLTVEGAIMPAGFDADLARALPPTLLVVRESDAAAVATRHILESWLRDYGIPYDVYLQREGEADDGWERMLAFQRQYLPAGDG